MPRPKTLPDSEVLKAAYALVHDRVGGLEHRAVGQGLRPGHAISFL